MKPYLKPGAGAWWGLIEDDEQGRLWVRLCEISTSIKDALGCYRVARGYFAFGILHLIASLAVRENGARVHRVDLKQIEESGSALKDAANAREEQPTASGKTEEILP